MIYYCCTADFGYHDENCPHHPKYRFEERVANLVKKGRTQEEAEEIVRTVILTKEQD